MPKRESPLPSELLPGTLDPLILQTLVLGPAHGHTMAHAIEHRSEEVPQIEHGSPAGRKQWIAQTSRCEQTARAIGRILKPAEE